MKSRPWIHSVYFGACNRGGLNGIVKVSFGCNRDNTRVVSVILIR